MPDITISFSDAYWARAQAALDATIQVQFDIKPRPLEDIIKSNAISPIDSMIKEYERNLAIKEIPDPVIQDSDRTSTTKNVPPIK